MLPSRLRSEVPAIHAATDTLGTPGSEVDGEVLLALAKACRDLVRVRFGYTAHDGTTTARALEPIRLVATGRRWYLMAFDLARDDWRTFRLDRMADVAATTWRFRAREHPDPVEFVGRSVSSPYPVLAKVRVLAAYDDVTARVPPTTAHVTRLDEGSCLLETGAGNIDALAFHLAWLGFELEVLEPPELRDALALLGARMTRAAGRGAGAAAATDT